MPFPDELDNLPTAYTNATEMEDIHPPLHNAVNDAINRMQAHSLAMATNLAALDTRLDALEAYDAEAADIEILTAINAAQTAYEAADTALDARVDALEAADARVTALHTTAALATDASEDWTLAEDGILALKVQTDQAARFRVYASAAYRTADAARAIGELPEGDHGLLLEVVTTATMLSVWLANPAICYSADGNDNLYCTVTNLDSAGAVDVTLTYVRTEN